MPSTLAHTLAGYAVHLAAGRRAPLPLWQSLLLANLADADVAAGLLRGEPMAYHGRTTHSLGAAVFAGAAAAIVSERGSGSALSAFSQGFAVYASHLALDYFGKESDEGLMLLWPVTRRRFAAGRPFFRTIRSRRHRYVSGIFTHPENARAILRETAVLLPPVLVARVMQRRGR